MKKRRNFRFVIILFVSIFILTQNISALGVAPAITKINFEPGLVKELKYTVIGANSGVEHEIYVKGDLAEYVELEKNIIVGGGEFKAFLKLPQDISTLVPGEHWIYIGVKEKIDEELIQGNIGTAVAIEVLIIVKLPYPGRYVDLKIKGHDVNVGEPVNFQLELQSKGTEDLTVSPRIEIFDNKNQKLDILHLQERLLPSLGYLGLQKSLDTTKYNPGNYRAEGIVDYGDEVRAETNFRIGELRIDIIGYTNRLAIGRLERFDIGIQSGWNDQIDGAYAEVSFLNGSSIITSFKTSTTTLIPWEAKNITGYVDTSIFEQGFYDANISIFYFGRDKGNSTSEIVKVEFIKGQSILIWYIVGGIGVILAVLVMYYLKKHGKIHKNKNKGGKIKEK